MKQASTSKIHNHELAGIFHRMAVVIVMEALNNDLLIFRNANDDTHLV